MAIDILNGWNSFSAEALEQRAIKATTKLGTSPRTTTTIKVCKSMKEVRESLQIDSSAAVTYGDFSADAKAKYMRSLNMTSNSVVVLARIVSEATDEIDGSADDLTMPAPLGTSEERIKFFYKYGDSYISSVTRGFEVLISYVLHATSREEQIKVAASIEGSGIAAGAKISAKFATDMENFSKESDLRWSLETDALGTGGFSVDPDNIEKAIDELKTRDPSASKHIVSFQATPYARLIDDSEESRQVQANLEALQGTSGRAGWAAKHWKLLEVKNAIEWVSNVYEIYGYEGDPSVRSRLKDVNDSLDRVEKFIKKVGKEPWKEADFPELDHRVLEEPSLVFDVRVSDVRFGGGIREVNYGMFGDVAKTPATYDRSSVPKGERIKRIRAYTGDWMNGLELTYDEALTGSGDRTVSNGNTTGNLAMDLELAKGMGIVAIHGLAGDAVNALQFEVKTPGGGTKKVQAGNTSVGGRQQTWTAGSGEFLFGFQGWGGRWLDTASPILVVFHPAKWGS